MKKCALFFLLCWYICTSDVPAFDIYEKDDLKFYVNFKEEIRLESWNTFKKKFNQDNFRYDRSYSFTSSKMRFGAGFNTPLLDGYIQFHWTQFFNLPDDADFGLGALYYKFNGAFGGPTTHPNKSTDIGYATISQGWLIFKPPVVPGFHLKVGRMFLFSGMEGGLPKNNTLKWLKKARISQRMIGPFGWSRVGRAFDGLLASYDSKYWNLTVSYTRPTPGGFYLRRGDMEENNESAHEIDIISATLSIKKGCEPFFT